MPALTLWGALPALVVAKEYPMYVDPSPFGAAATSAAALPALDLLRRARDAAAQLNVDRWEFAVGLAELLAAGASETDVRWLVAKGYAQHAVERVRPDVGMRTFRRIANFALTARTCLVLTNAG